MRSVLLLFALATAGCSPVSFPFAPSTAAPLPLVNPTVQPQGPQLIVPDRIQMVNAPQAVVGPEYLECTISAPPICELGLGPRIQVRITNKSDQDIYLIRHLDASEECWRYPYCYFEVTVPPGAPLQGSGRCKLMSELLAEDFILVPGGTSFDPFARPDDVPVGERIPDGVVIADMHSHLVQKPGVYRFRFVYSTASPTLIEYAGSPMRSPVENDPEILERFRQVPRVEIKSNEIEVRVLPRSANSQEPPRED